MDRSWLAGAEMGFAFFTGAERRRWAGRASAFMEEGRAEMESGQMEEETFLLQFLFLFLLLFLLVWQARTR